MKTTALLKVNFIVVTLLFSGFASAGEAKVTWLNPQGYTDIASNSGSQDKFQKSLFKTLDDIFNKNGNVLEVVVTNFDMAGQMRVGPKGSYTRIVQNSLFPQMTLNYKLEDASGTVVKEQQNVIFKDMNYYNITNTVKQSQLNESFYYEGAMINRWFANTFQQAEGQP
jgi:hypothetical protein